MEILVLFIILQLFAAGFFLFLCLAFVTGGPFVPSSRKSVQAMVDLANIKPGDTIMDLGSGDGRTLFAAADRGAHAIGLEINPYLVWYTNLWAKFHRKKGTVNARWANIWKTKFPKSDVVFVYLIPWRMEELAAKLEREMKPGTIVVSNSFMFPKWKSIRKDPANHVYAYKL
jgi:SAM-dependent methyltransferase